MPKIEKAPHRPWQPEREAHGRRMYANTKFYASSAWRKLRALKIKLNPICEECATYGRATPGEVIDHIKPINQGGAPLSIENLQTLCHACHNRKSGQEAHTARRSQTEKPTPQLPADESNT